ncbi:MAG: anti-sigma factor [Pirellulales bacterium]
MQCEEFEDRLNAVLDERRRPEWDAELSLHRESCAGCRQLAAAYDRLLDGFYALAAPEAPDDLALRVVAELRPQPAPRRQLAIAVAVLATAATVLIAVVPLWRDQTSAQPGKSLAHAKSLSPPSPSAAAAQLPLVQDLLAISDAPGGDPYAGLAKGTGQSLAAVIRFVPGVGLGGGAPETATGSAPAGAAEPAWAEQVSEGLKPITNSVTETFYLLLDNLPLAQSSARS